VEESEHGVWWVGLVSLSDPTLLPQVVAQALGVREEPNRPLTETLTDHLEPRETLLILDNCEARNQGALRGPGSGDEDV